MLRVGSNNLKQKNLPSYAIPPCHVRHDHLSPFHDDNDHPNDDANRKMDSMTTNVNDGWRMTDDN